MDLTRILQNQKGSVLVSAVALLPLLLTVLAVGVAAYFVLNNEGESTHACRVALLNSQNQVSGNLKALLDLNPAAQELRNEREAAEAAMKLPMEPAERTAAEAFLLLVKQKQFALALRQQQLIRFAQVESMMGPQRAYTQMQSSLMRARSVQDGRGTGPMKSNVHRPKFHVVAKPVESETPDYQPAPSFSDEQTSSVKIDLPVDSLLPDWLNRLAQVTGLTLETTCTSTIVKGDKGWVATLKADRS